MKRVDRQFFPAFFIKTLDTFNTFRPKKPQFSNSFNGTLSFWFFNMFILSPRDKAPEQSPRIHHFPYHTVLSCGSILWWHKRWCCNSLRHYWLSRNGNASNTLASQRKQAKKQDARNTSALLPDSEKENSYKACTWSVNA